MLASLPVLTAIIMASHVLGALPLWATEPFEPPQGAPVLTVTGALATAHGTRVVLDRALLNALPRQSIETSTIWTKGTTQFDGVPITALLDRLGMTSGTPRLTAVNGYSIDIPVSALLENDPIIAGRMNGCEMSLRDKGPLWLVYPYDTDPKYQTEVIFARSIWQLDRIEIRD